MKELNHENTTLSLFLGTHTFTPTDMHRFRVITAFHYFPLWSDILVLSSCCCYCSPFIIVFNSLYNGCFCKKERDRERKNERCQRISELVSNLDARPWQGHSLAETSLKIVCENVSFQICAHAWKCKWFGAATHSVCVWIVHSHGSWLPDSYTLQTMLSGTIHHSSQAQWDLPRDSLASQWSHLRDKKEVRTA